MKKIHLFLIVTLLLIKFSEAQWQSTPGPYLSSNYIGMDIDHIVVSDNNIIYAIIENRLYLSNNNGTSWMYASYGLENYGPRCVVCSDSTIFVGTFNNGVFLSNNFGSTFIAINNGLPPNSRIKAIFSNDNIILASHYLDYSNKGVYISTNGGDTWSLTNGLENEHVKCFASNGEKIYAGSTHGVYMSIDNGHNWSSIGLPYKSIVSIAAQGNYIFGGESSTGGGLFLSMDNGNNWTQINNANGLTTTFFYDIAIYNNYVYVASDGVYRSVNFGVSWEHTSLNCNNVNTIAVNNNKVYAGCGDGFSISTNNGQSWYNNIKTYNLEIKSVVSSCNNIITSTDYLLFKSGDNGVTWEQFLYLNNALASNDSVVFSGFETALQRSFNCGNSFSSVGVEGLPDDPNITAIAMNDSMSFVGTYGYGVYFSGDSGNNWEQRNNGLTSLNINSLSFADTIILAATNNNGVFISTNNGLNWASINSGINDTCIQAIACYRDNFYAGSKNHGIFKSTDNGENWVQLNNGLSDTNILTLYTCGVNIFAGSLGGGFYMSPDNGTTWSKYNDALLNYNVKSIMENGNDIFIGTHHGGLWKRPLVEIPLTFSFKEISVYDKVICEGYSSNIQVDVVGGSLPYSFLWSNGMQTSSITITPLTTTTYSLTVTDSNLDTITEEITIIVKPKPETPIIYQSGDTLISSSVDGNIWILNNQTAVYSDSNIYIPDYNGYYSVIVVRNGCVSDTSNIIYLGIDNLISNQSFSIYPNPSSDKIVVEILHPIKMGDLKIYNTNGKVLIEEQIWEGKTVIDLKNLANGVYFVKLINDKYVEVKKIILK